MNFAPDIFAGRSAVVTGGATGDWLVHCTYAGRKCRHRQP